MAHPLHCLVRACPTPEVIEHLVSAGAFEELAHLFKVPLRAAAKGAAAKGCGRAILRQRGAQGFPEHSHPLATLEAAVRALALLIAHGGERALARARRARLPALLRGGALGEDDALQDWRFEPEEQGRVRHLRRLAARTAAELMAPVLAFLMGQHARLARQSPLILLDSDVLRLVVEYFAF